MNGRRELVPLAICLMILAVLLVGCGGAAGGSALQDTQWVLATFAGEPPLPGTAPSAEFSADEISGSAGCNTYFAAYAVDGSELTISDVASTEMWCAEPEGVMDQEQAFLAALRSAAGYRLAGAQLELLDATDRVILTFGPRPASP
jgi:heat shock protein HslJ